ncbi:redoxin domain-containing protein [Marine Group I thaumarchaeote]|uniref:Redoxin domain-containing protein n=1 Tax=Marine Group I thaumarchaeote TaxID=2511932 RepID=A0A7K4MBN7_9ARCH|nr:redoxin domain-containing protein [Candidatus Nitrosopumilus sp. MTA1]NWJ20885.1 redoxin domain-containing protein [Marine Group I thaumarchaeote]NWJ28562.1 redoxin domain-containing protein [Marine Group I thaumarchaeote]NWJ30037.1 redoxin domain-containing protein [Marine Group I thaumarchaeote]NWJ57155.1 redoxin domain-containing protein [Marine Group I thaumarchaeote]
MSAVIGEKVPNFGVSEWIQGAPTNFDQEKDHVVLLEVFQVNCPGCFMNAIPEAISIYNKYKDEGVRVLGIATAFEDFDKNTLENLKMLVETGEVIGETKNALSMYGKLQDGNKLSYKIPFPLGMDNLTKTTEEISQEKIMQFIYPQIPEFDSQPEEYKNKIIQKVKDHMKSKEYLAETFEKFSLQGTPSAILVDRKGILRDVSFGQSGRVEAMIQKLLGED